MRINKLTGCLLNFKKNNILNRVRTVLMKYGDFMESPLNSTAIKYTVVPFVVFTGSHCKVIDVKVLFLSVGVPGIGGLDPSPFLTSLDESVFKYFRSLQLASQLLELVCKIRGKLT